MKKLVVLAMTALCATLSSANDLDLKRIDTGKIEVEKDYRFEGDIGYLVNQSKSEGNTTSTKENLSLHVLYQRQAQIWGQEVVAEAVSTNDDSADRNVERYFLSGKLLHRSSETVYQYGKLTVEKDLSSAFDYQLTATGGLGKDLIKNDIQSLSAEVGVGYRYSKERDIIPQASSSKEAIATVTAFYQYQITPTVRFNQDLGYEYGDEVQTIRSRTALSIDVSKHFSALASYNLKDTHADAGDNRDSLLSLGLRYKY